MSESNAPISFAMLLEKCQRIVIPQIQRDYAQGREKEVDIRNAFLDALDAIEQGNAERPSGAPIIRRPRHVSQPPSRLNALRWLWEAPGNS